MNTPEWGATFFDNAVQRGAKMYWGARGAIRFSKYDLKRFLDLYPDRQSFVADNPNRKEEFVDWLNHHVIPYLEKRVSFLVIHGCHNKLVAFYIVLLKAVILPLEIVMPYGNTA